MPHLKSKEFISKNKLAPIAKTHSIDNLQSFHEKINSVAEIFFWTKTNYEDHPPNKQTLKAIKKVKDQATKLAKTIDDLSDYENRWFWMAHRKVRMYSPTTHMEDITPYEERVVHINECPIHIEGTKDGGIQYYYPEIDEIRHTITTIETFAQYGIDNLPKGRNGRVKRHGLYMLIANLKNYWEQGLGRSFTFDEYEGEGITEAYFFCRDVTQALDPTVSPTQINSQMRKVISRN